MTDRARLEALTRRWRQRHDAKRSTTGERPPATTERETLAQHAFPFREVTPAVYVAEHGEAMAGFTYDEERYTDAELDAWLLEVGRLLRLRRGGPDR